MFTRLLDAQTLKVMGSGFAVAIFFLLPAVQHHFIGYILYRGLSVGDILFHEIGHAIFYWLFGKPAIPSILTAIGANMAGGYTMAMGYSRMVHAVALGALAYGCYVLYITRRMIFWLVLPLAVAIAVLGFGRYTEWIIAYMGHGTAILAGGVLLYRAWLDIIVSSEFERWCNAVFGFFITLNNANFARRLVFDGAFRGQYENAPVEMDFIKMVDMPPFYSLSSIAWFTLVVAGVTILLSFLLAAYFYEDEHYDSF